MKLCTRCHTPPIHAESLSLSLSLSQFSPDRAAHHIIKEMDGGSPRATDDLSPARVRALT